MIINSLFNCRTPIQDMNNNPNFNDIKYEQIVIDIQKYFLKTYKYNKRVQSIIKGYPKEDLLSDLRLFIYNEIKHKIKPSSINNTKAITDAIKFKLNFAVCEARTNYNRLNQINNNDLIDHYAKDIASYDEFNIFYNQDNALSGLLKDNITKEDLQKNIYIAPVLLERIHHYKDYKNWFSSLIKENNLKRKEISTLANEIFNNKKIFLLELYPKIIRLNHDYNKRLELIPQLSQVWLSNFALDLLRKTNIKTQMNLLKNTSEKDHYYISDSILMAKNINTNIPGNFGYLNQVHDYLIAYLRKNGKAINATIITQNIKLKKLTFKKYTVNVPKTEKELRDIGNFLNNCVGSYAEKLRSNNSIVVTLMKDQSYIYCIEIDPDSRKIKQFVAKSNQSKMDTPLAKEFQDFINTNWDYVY